MKKHIFSMIFITTLAIFEVNNLFAQEFSSNEFCSNSQIAINKVEVLVDNIREERIEEQIRDIARAQFSTIAEAENSESLTVNITVRQRSYYKNIDNRNSIYVHYTICNGAGKTVFEECICTEGSGSIVSAAMQAKQMGKATRGIRKFLKKQSLETPETFIAKK